MCVSCSPHASNTIYLQNFRIISISLPSSTSYSWKHFSGRCYMCFHKKGNYIMRYPCYIRARTSHVDGGMCCVCPFCYMAEPLQLSFSDADGGYKFITPWSRKPIIQKTGFCIRIHCTHLSVQVCKTPLCERTTCAAHCVCLHCPGWCADVRNGEGQADR